MPDLVHYVDSAGWSAMTAWATGTVIAAGDLRRQNAAPAVNDERAFIAIVAGTTHASTEPTWPTTRGGKVTDNTVTWQECTGIAAVNGDVTNTANWTSVKNTTITIGQIIKNDAATHYFICSTSGTAGNGTEPTWGTTAGDTTADNTVTWTCIGAVGTFTGGQAPHRRLATAYAGGWTVAGNKVYAKDTHAESVSSGDITWTLAQSTLASPVMTLCHDGGAYPPAAANLSLGATVTLASAGAIFVNPPAGYFDGINLVLSVNGSYVTFGQTDSWVRWRNSTISITHAGSLAFINVGSSSCRVDWDDVWLSFSHTGQEINTYSTVFNWRGGGIMGSAIPTNLFQDHGGTAIQIDADVYGVDLSAAGSGKTLVQSLTMAGHFNFYGCELGASVTIASAPSTANLEVNTVNCSSGPKSYGRTKHTYQGNLTTEETIVLSGGASDGAMAYSWKVITTANPEFISPFECPPIAAFNDVVGTPRTATIQGTWGGGAVPNNDDIWVELEYPGDGSTAGSPRTLVVSDAKATVLTAAAGQSAGAGSWGGGTTPFKLDVTFTAELEGPVVARVMCAKASSTFYIDPRLEVQ